MKTIKKLLLIGFLFGSLNFGGGIDALAQGGELPFLTKIEKKLSVITKALRGGFAKTLTTIVIVIVGFGWFSGRINKGFAITVLAGAFLVMFAPNLSDWLFTE